MAKVTLCLNITFMGNIHPKNNSENERPGSGLKIMAFRELEV